MRALAHIGVHILHSTHFEPIKFLVLLSGICVFTNIDTKESLFTLNIVSLVLFSFYILLWFVFVFVL